MGFVIAIGITAIIMFFTGYLYGCHMGYSKRKDEEFYRDIAIKNALKCAERNRGNQPSE